VVLAHTSWFVFRAACAQYYHPCTHFGHKKHDDMPFDKKTFELIFLSLVHDLSQTRFSFVMDHMTMIINAFPL
jgi:hypothetical protein